jgi:hypothetical protein
MALEKLRSVVLASGPFAERNVLLHNIAPDVADQNRGTVYPAAYLYAARMENLPRQKFAGFSGPIRLAADLRCTGERYDGLEREITSHVEAVTAALASSTGSWGEGLVYSGAYAVKFEPVKLGGRNFLQSAKIEIEIEACG